MKEALQKDVSLKTTLNGIFKSGVSPLHRTSYNEFTEATLIDDMQNYERQKSMTKNTKKIEKSHSAYKVRREEMERKQTVGQKNKNHKTHVPQSDEKVFKKASLLKEANQVINDYESQKNMLENSDLANLEESTSEVFPEAIARPPTMEVPNAAIIEYRNEDLQTPERSPAKKSQLSESRYNDEVSGFGIFTPKVEIHMDDYQTTKVEDEQLKTLVDVEILLKEYELGKDLLNNAADKVGEDDFKKLLTETLDARDYEIIQVFMSLLLSVCGDKDHFVSSIQETRYWLTNSNEIHRIQSNFNVLIESKDFKGESTIKFRDEFVKKSTYEPTILTIKSIKEYL